MEYFPTKHVCVGDKVSKVKRCSGLCDVFWILGSVLALDIWWIPFRKKSIEGHCVEFALVCLKWILARSRLLFCLSFPLFIKQF